METNAVNEDESMEWVESFKYLGVYVDEQLSLMCALIMFVRRCRGR